MKIFAFSAITALTLAFVVPTAVHAGDSVHDYKVKNIDGEEVDLSSYKGKALLIVNVASECGATPQYATLVALQKQYKDKGLVVLGFPANNFGGQEPGSNEEIKKFCASNYQVDFPMFAKVSVAGDDKVPLFAYLAGAENPDKQGDIGWNFEKFLVGKDGKLLRRFGTGVEPDDSDLTAAIDAAVK